MNVYEIEYWDHDRKQVETRKIAADDAEQATRYALAQDGDWTLYLESVGKIDTGESACSGQV